VPHANDEQTPTGTGLSGATAADSESIGRGSKHSKRSFMGKRRAGSTASSKRRAATLEKTTQPPATPATAHREGSTRSKSKRSGGGLLACLPCFAPKEHRETGDNTPPENVKQAAPVKTSRTSQSTPVKKQDTSAAESSNAESSIPLDEKTGNGDYATGAAEKASVGDGTVERPSHENRPQIVTRSSSKRQQAEQTLPPQPSTLLPVPIDIQVTQPTPGSTPVLPRPSAEQSRIIEDQTEEQKQLDSDIEMKDVPLSTNDVHQEGEDPNADDPDHPKVDLPPPPPLEQRQDVVQKQTSEMSDVSEPQKYLLGPIAPRFKGKKCLVLDLDETLVHSSFKVCHAFKVITACC
jgi:RNA polymerase II subunit A small phosphatase-like protein